MVKNPKMLLVGSVAAAALVFAGCGGGSESSSGGGEAPKSGTEICAGQAPFTSAQEVADLLKDALQTGDGNKWASAYCGSNAIFSTPGVEVETTTLEQDTETYFYFKVRYKIGEETKEETVAIGTRNGPSDWVVDDRPTSFDVRLAKPLNEADRDEVLFSSVKNGVKVNGFPCPVSDCWTMPGEATIEVNNVFPEYITATFPEGETPTTQTMLIGRDQLVIDYTVSEEAAKKAKEVVAANKGNVWSESICTDEDVIWKDPVCKEVEETGTMTKVMANSPDELAVLIEFKNPEIKSYWSRVEIEQDGTFKAHGR